MANQFIHRISPTATSQQPFDTNSCFDSTYIESTYSPIDHCFEKFDVLNLIHVKFNAIAALNQQDIDTQNNLILLGYISAVESYLREIIRKLILIDDSCRVSSESQTLNYGAALNYQTEMLPEALLEKSSYASKKNIMDSFKNFLGLKGQVSAELTSALEEFEKICHLRHCIVHRFGKLGSSNAIKLGLDSHSYCLEKPIQIDTNKLFSINTICQNTVSVINDYLYKKILLRTTNSNFSNWCWDLRRDKSKFKIYYDIFYCTVNSPPNSDLKSTYNALRDYQKNS